MENSFIRLFPFLLVSIVGSAAPAFSAEKRTYRGVEQVVDLTFTVTPGDPLDKISGTVKFRKTGFKGPVKGTYNEAFDSFVASAKDGAGRNRAIVGNYDADADTFYLQIRVSKKVTAQLVCPRKQKSSKLLTGKWQVNDASFFPVIITEAADGVITGKGGSGFEDYRVEGQHMADDTVIISLLSPNGDDDSTYNLKLCGSKSTMIGTTDSAFSPEATWCRKNRVVSDVCQADLTCAP